MQSKPEKFVIMVYPKVPSLFRRVLSTVAWWLCLVTAIGGSKFLFGGSWVIDSIALAAACLSVFAIVRKSTQDNRGLSIVIAHQDMKEWVDAGMPRPWIKADGTGS